MMFLRLAQVQPRRPRDPGKVFCDSIAPILYSPQRKSLPQHPLLTQIQQIEQPRLQASPPAKAEADDDDDSVKEDEEPVKIGLSFIFVHQRYAVKLSQLISEIPPTPRWGLAN
jgi:hypothetical protein